MTPARPSRMRVWLAGHDWGRRALRLVLSVLCAAVMAGLGVAGGMPRTWSIVLAVVCVGVTWATRSLVSAWTPALGRATAWVAVLAAFGAAGGLLGVLAPVCSGRCTVGQDAQLVLLTMAFPTLVLIYTGPAVWAWGRLRALPSALRRRRRT